MKALKILMGKRADNYAAAVKSLHDDTRESWMEELEDDEADIEELDGDAYTADAQSLRRFLEEEILPFLESRRDQLLTLPVIREQVLKESFDPRRMESLARYEVHLDRKLERMLAMLVRLRDLRQSKQRQLIRFAKVHVVVSPASSVAF